MFHDLDHFCWIAAISGTRVSSRSVVEPAGHQASENEVVEDLWRYSKGSFGFQNKFLVVEASVSANIFLSFTELGPTQISYFVGFKLNTISDKVAAAWKILLAPEVVKINPKK